MFALIRVKDSLPMRDGMIGNSLKTALSHMKSHFFFCRIRLLVINSVRKQVLDFSCFFVGTFVVQSHGHWNPGSVSFLGSLDF